MRRSAFVAVFTVLMPILLGCDNVGERCLNRSSTCSAPQGFDDSERAFCLNAGCQWGGSCVHRTCEGLDPNSCAARGDCFWSDAVQVCAHFVGTAPSCEYDGGACDAHIDCAYVIGCFGGAPACDTFKKQGECSANPFCEWDPGHGRLTTGLNDFVRRDDRLLCEWRDESSAGEPQ
jgi:hypothetical protein